MTERRYTYNRKFSLLLKQSTFAAVTMLLGRVAHNYETIREKNGCQEWEKLFIYLFIYLSHHN